MLYPQTGEKWILPASWKEIWTVRERKRGEKGMEPDYPTWYVNLWYSSDRGLSRWLSETLEEARAVGKPEEALAVALRDNLRDNNPLQEISSIYSDLLNWAIGKIEFHELAYLLLED